MATRVCLDRARANFKVRILSISSDTMLKNFSPGSSLKPEINDYIVQYIVVCSDAEKNAVL